MQASYPNKKPIRLRGGLMERLALTSAAGPLAKVDVRAKILISLLASVMTIALSNPAAQCVLAGFSMLYALGVRQPKLLAGVYLICLIMLGVAAGFAALVSSLTPLPGLSLSGLAVPFLRLLVTVNVLLPLAFRTPPQSLLTALKSLRLPFFLYIPLAAMLRYLPTFFADAKQIFEALQIRGYSFSCRQFLRQPLLSLRFIVTPLLFRSLKTSEYLGIAAELKGLGAGRKPRPYRALTWKQSDSRLVALAVLACLAALAVSLAWPEAGPGLRGMR